jgi:hypothetical protein
MGLPGRCHLDSSRASAWAGITKVLISTAIALFVTACSDPGSGGSGIPSGAGVNAPGATPDPNSPGGTPSPVNLSAQRIEALEADAVTIAGIRYLATQLEVVFADGTSAGFAAFKVGQSVVISPAPSSSATPSWKVTIQAP